MLTLVGVALLPLLPVKLNASVSLPSFKISYAWQGADARIMEQEVTSVLEALLSKISGIKKVSSVSSNGKGTIVIELDKTKNFDAARLEAAMLIREAYISLPQEVSFPRITTNHPDEGVNKPLLSYSLNSAASPALIQQYAEDRILTILSAIEGVADIKVYGAAPMEWLLEYDDGLMHSVGITLNDIRLALRRYLWTEPAGMGFQTQPTDTAVTHLILRNYNAGNTGFMDVPVKKRGTKVIYVRDVISIRHQEQEPTAYYRINGVNTINIVIHAREQENHLRLSEKVKAAIALMRESLPPGYSLLNTFDSTEFIRQEIWKNMTRAFFTLGILFLFVFLVSKSLRYLLLIALSLMATLGIAVILYYLTGLDIHLYSLAALTVSLGLMVDNIIVVMDHYRRYGNLKVFLATLAATLSTMSALIVVFFLNENIRQSFIDFSLIIIINLVASLLVVLFLLPALLRRFPLVKKPIKKKKHFPIGMWSGKQHRASIHFGRWYQKTITFALRFKLMFFFVALLGFGIPLYLLPEKIEHKGLMARAYNYTFGSKLYTERIRPVSDKMLGGTLRLFMLDALNGSYVLNNEKTTLYVNSRMPHGSTTRQMNDMIIRLESYLKKFNEIDQFQTLIPGNGSASITIYFKDVFENSGFPFLLQELLIRKANELGGADWNIYGAGKGFNNAVQESTGSFKITMRGYNYDMLYALAEKAVEKLSGNMRVKESYIGSDYSRFRNYSTEYVLDFDGEKLGSRNISAQGVYAVLRSQSIGENIVGRTIVEGKQERINLISKDNKTSDAWLIGHSPQEAGNSMLRLHDLSSIEQVNSDLNIVKEEQQYQLIVSYDFVGTESLANEYQETIISEIKQLLLVGFTVESGSQKKFWDKESKKQYWLLVLIIGMIYILCCILFNSLLQPLAVILVIPISYIGIFITFYLCDITFDMGGFAAFILLSGITVNAALYIINDYNVLRKRYGHTKDRLTLYIKAYNRKIIPILLTILSTVFGLLSFFYQSENEVFWPALAAGTIGGLLFSLTGVIIFLPILLFRRKPGIV
jgi:multidrug efflux pump subunit AcrB